MNTDEQTFMKGFNAGYLLCKYETELVQRLITDNHARTEYFKAMELGKRAYEREKVIEVLRAAKDKNRDREQGL